MANVQRTHSTLGRTNGLTTLEQRFLFTGGGADAANIIRTLLSAPLVGSDSVFGERPGQEASSTGPSRRLRGFSPAPGFRFDVELSRYAEDILLVEFSQPERDVPYLQGALVWTVTDGNGGAEFDEQINTESALRISSNPLTGSSSSLRRWLFFRAGHQQVMSRATANLAALLDREAYA